MMLPLFIYHGGCFDGFTSAWVFNRLLGPAEWFPASYGEAPPDVTGREVWIVDFCYPREVMFRLACDALSLTILDHHKTAEENMKGLEGQVLGEAKRGRLVVYFEADRSGCGLLWRYLTASDVPWLVDYVEDRDLWRLKLPGTKEVAAWIAAQPMTFDAWDEMEKAGQSKCAESGEAVLRYIEQYGRKAREHARVENIAGHLVPTMNLPYMNCSEHVGELLKEHPEAEFAASYFRRADGKWKFSLRSVPAFDVSDVARKFGGGGHAQAAGFECDRLPW